MGSEAGTELWIIFYPAKIKLSLSLHVVALVGQSNGGHCVLSFSNYVCLGGRGGEGGGGREGGGG